MFSTVSVDNYVDNVSNLHKLNDYYAEMQIFGCGILLSTAKLIRWKNQFSALIILTDLIIKDIT